MYALAAELKVPILIHFQEVDHFENEGTWSTGFAKTFESILKAYPKTTFIGHADAFWANVSADYHNEAAYPSGPIVRGGITDKLLGDYANLLRRSVGQLRQQRAVARCRSSPRTSSTAIRTSCCSAATAAAPTVTARGVSQGDNPAAARLAGKCVARETLTVLKRSTSPAAFAEIVWGNAHKLLTIPA